MPPTQNGQPPFTVTYPAAVIAQIQAWGQVARAVGLRDEFLAAAHEMDDRLKHSPDTWGDPLRDLTGMIAKLYRRYGSVLMVFYAVHDIQRVVLVQHVVLTPGSPLADAVAGQG